MILLDSILFYRHVSKIIFNCFACLMSADTAQSFSIMHMIGGANIRC